MAEMSELSKKRANSALFTLILSLILFWFGDRLGIVAVQIGDGFIVQGIGSAFLSVVPSIIADPFLFDVAIQPLGCGIVFFAITWLCWLYYFNQIGNYRTGEESGSARWGTKKEGMAFKDQDNPENNLLFTENYGLAISRKKFDLERDRNLNVLCVGGSGSGKTRNYVKPQLLQLNANYFVTDPKGTLIGEVGHLFEDNDCRIKVFNTIQFDRSLHYNPLRYVKTDADILSFVNCFIKNTNDDNKTGGDAFWENSERLLYTALIAFLRDYFPPEDYSLSGLLTLLSLAEAKEDDENFESPLDLLFKEIETGKCIKKINSTSSTSASSGRSVAVKSSSAYKEYPSTFKRNSDGKRPADCGGFSPDEDFALKNYHDFKTAAGKTLKSILISCNVRLAPLAIKQVREIIKDDEMELDRLGDPDYKGVVFAILSDTDRTFSFLHAIMMWQTLDILCRKALEDYGGKLPRLVNFVLDEFANIGTLPDIEKTIAVTRSRNIALSIILQSISQLESRYDKDAKTIVDCCDSLVFLGGKSNDTNKEIAEMIGKQTINQVTASQSSGQSSSSSVNRQIQGRELIDAAEIGKMSRKKAIVLIAGTNPLMDNKYPVDKHPRYKYIDPGHDGALYADDFDFVEYTKKQRASE